MSAFYKILTASPMGEPYTPSQPGAKAIQSYWCQVEGREKSVMIGKQVGNTLTPGQHVYGDLVFAVSQKGTEYWKFKSQQVPEGVTRPADTPAQATAQQATGQVPNASDQIPGWAITLVNMVEFIYKEMKKMSDAEEAIEAEDKKPDLDDIFNEDAPVED